MGGILCCCCKSLCGDCCEPYDHWSIEAETRPGEKGAGFLYKRGKGAAIWSKRYFAITETKLIYYLEQDRVVAKGEIVLSGATARVSSTRIGSRKQHYFEISHPECGKREFYAKSKNRRTQWIDKINMVSESLAKDSCYGILLKQGGMSKNVWQERWCICAGRQLDYFENASDNQAKGSIDLLNAKIREFSSKDKKFCFEISSAYPGKKGNKKYIFAIPNEKDVSRWMDMIRKCSLGLQDRQASMESESSKSAVNPMQISNLHDDEDEVTFDEDIKPAPPITPAASTSPKPVDSTKKTSIIPSKAVEPTKPAEPTKLFESAKVAEPVKIESSRPSSVSVKPVVASNSSSAHPLNEPPRPSMTESPRPSSIAYKSSESSIASSVSRQTSVSLVMPPEKSGYLEKLSPKRLVGWQKRYFVLKSPGILLYYGSESEVNSGNPKGDIQIADIVPGSMGIKLIEGKNEIAIMIENRNFSLRASNASDAQAWVTLLKAWQSYINGSD